MDLNTFQDDMKRNRKLLEIKKKVRAKKVKKDGVDQPISEESSQQSLYQLDYDEYYLRDGDYDPMRVENVLTDTKSEVI